MIQISGTPLFYTLLTASTVCQLIDLFELTFALCQHPLKDKVSVACLFPNQPLSQCCMVRWGQNYLATKSQGHAQPYKGKPQTSPHTVPLLVLKHVLRSTLSVDQHQKCLFLFFLVDDKLRVTLFKGPMKLYFSYPKNTQNTQFFLTINLSLQCQELVQ